VPEHRQCAAGRKLYVRTVW